MKKNTLRIIIIAIAAILLIGLIVYIKSRLSRTAEDPEAGLIGDNQSYVEVFIGDTPISEYYILNKGAGTANAELLQGYCEQVHRAAVEGACCEDAVAGVCQIQHG